MDPNAKFQVEVDPNEDTEWNDILRSHGIIPEKPKDESEQLEEALEEALQKLHENRLENKDLDELDALEDEEDEEFLNFYKQKRMLQILELRKKSKFGSVYPITKPEYQKEVSEASKDCFVFVHMTLQSSLQSRLLSSLCRSLAAKYPEIKFVEIPANRAVENYPDLNCPTILVYHQNELVKQLITLVQLGGNSTNLKDLEKFLVQVKALDERDTRLIINQDGGDTEWEEKKLTFAKKSLRGSSINHNDEDDDDFFD